jgi:two-component system, NtrC family, sensor histidine kinase HydH
VKRVKLHPLTVIIIAGTMALIMFVTAYVEVRQSRLDAMTGIQDQAVTLINTIMHSAETTTLSNEEMESLVAARLLVVGKVIAEYETMHALTPELLDRFAIQNDVMHISLYDASGRMTLSCNWHREHAIHTDPQLLARLSGISARRDSSVVLGLVTSASDGETRYLAAVSRRRVPGLILLELDTQELLQFRKRIGIGALIRNIADNPGIVYVSLQDSLGIVAASRNGLTLSSIAGDPFLRQAIDLDSSLTRTIEYEGVPRFEVAAPFYVNTDFKGIFRVALSLERVDALNARTIERFIILSLIIIVGGVIVFGFLTASQGYSLLQQEYKKFQTYTGTVLDNVADAVIAADRSGTITVFNKSAEALFGAEAAMIIGKECSLILPGTSSCIDRTLSTGTAIDYEESTVRLFNHRTLLLAFSTSVIRDEHGTIDTVVAVLRDMTEQRHVEEQLRRREKMSAMGELAAGVAHEIRNPLNAIGMTVQRFEKDFEPSADRDEYFTMVTMMKEEVARVNAIIAQFLRFARPPRLNRTDTSISEFIADTLAIVHGEAQSRRIALMVCGESEGTFPFDREQMKQVFLNIIQNAMQAIGTDGTVTVEARRKDEHLCFSISDTGPGIAKETLSKIFDPYFSTKPDGTGIGMSIAQQIIAEHGGTIDVDSAPGRGTTFTLTIPRT